MATYLIKSFASTYRLKPKKYVSEDFKNHGREAGEDCSKQPQTFPIANNNMFEAVK